ncbi:tRNA lysidine(34) synthetase TilS [Anaerosinus massiliensis]|uniref:tRNA lysidine(34) synthetase TilS n=1 Tax=Massilibacillus massiliensis TaxID=1806837 RepID=UPI000A408806|nr:tRNA lysidine(34) synthetase TilS [Massilibacillus massiliensis]
MLEKVKCYCKEKGLLELGDTILIACSGGPDSLALVDIFLKLRNSYQLEVAVAHVDHMFRGEDSRADAIFVEEFCLAHQIPYYKKSFDVPAYSKKMNLSPEEAARIVRYDFLKEIASFIGNAKIATGHHKDDQAETVLIHLFRGAGSAGIAGIRPMNHGIIRPFLSVTRQEIEAYCKENRLNPRIDQTNYETEYLRNRIRLNLLPELVEKFNPAIKEALCKSAEIIGAEHAFIRNSVESIWNRLVIEEKNRFILQRKKLNCLHIAQKRELFRLAIEKKQGHLRGISFTHVEKMIVLSEKGSVGTKIILPGGLTLQCNYQHMLLGTFNEKQKKQNTMQVIINLVGDTQIPNLGIIARTEWVHALNKIRDKNAVILDFEQLVPPLFIKFRQDGDRFQPSGMQGNKKLKDFFIDQKVEWQLRDSIPLLCDQQRILWVCGYRQSEIGRVVEKTKKFLRVSIIKDQS